MHGNKSQKQIHTYVIKRNETEVPFLPSQLRFEQSDPQLPGAPTGPTGGASRRIQGEIRLPPLPPPLDPVVAPDAEQPDEERPGEDMAPSTEMQGTNFPSQGGGVLPPIQPPAESEDFRDLFEDFNRESDEILPLEPLDEASSRLEEQQELGQGGFMSSRPPRQLRSRNVARSVKGGGGGKTVKFHDMVECVELDQHYREKLNLEGKYTIFPSSQHQEDINAIPCEKWEPLYDPTPSRALKENQTTSKHCSTTNAC